MPSTTEIFGLCTSAIVGAALAYHSWLSFRRKGEAPVRWSWLLWLGYAIDMGKRPIELLQESQDMFGEIFGLIIAGQRFFIIADVESTSAILRPSKDLSWQEFHNSILQNFFNVSPTTLSNHDVMAENMIRKWYSEYLLSDKHLLTATHRMQKKLYKNIKSVENAVHPMYWFISKFIFHASMSAIFNEACGDDDALYQAFLDFDVCMPYCAGGAHSNYFAKSAVGREMLTKAAATYTDDLSGLMARRFEYFSQQVKENNLSPGECEKLQIAILWASVSNTMPVTFWVIYRLITNPKLLQEARDEISRVAPDLSNDHLITQNELDNMIYIDACITEVLRLYSGSLIMRFVKNDCELTLASGNKYKFRKGDRVGLCPPLFHHDNEIFPDAESFVPSRWLLGETLEERIAAACGKIPMKKNGKELPSTSIFLPFGAGVTLCPGRRFARNEIKILLIFILRQLNFEIVDPSAEEPSRNNSRAGIGVFPPVNDIQVRVSVV